MAYFPATLPYNSSSTLSIVVKVEFPVMYWNGYSVNVYWFLRKAYKTPFNECLTKHTNSPEHCNISKEEKQLNIISQNKRAIIDIKKT